MSDKTTPNGTAPNKTALRLGLAAPVFASPGIAGMRTPSFERLSWEPVRDAVLLAEELGYDSVWFSDHLFHGRDGAFFESCTALAALAGSTERIRLVNNHLCNNFRPAPMTAKTSSTLDVISGGRFELFLSPGMREREHTSYGFGWEPSRSVRTRQLAEAVRVIRKLWSGAAVDFDGEFYHLDGAISMPTPVQPGGPPVWIGGVLDDVTLELIVTQADGWNTFPASLTEYARLAALVDAACRMRGRDPLTLKRSLETQVLVLDSPADEDRWMDTWDAMRERSPLGDAVSDMVGLSAPVNDREAAWVRLRDDFIIGTREQVAAKLSAYAALGVTDVICWFMDFPSDASMRALASEIRLAIHSA